MVALSPEVLLVKVKLAIFVSFELSCIVAPAPCWMVILGVVQVITVGFNVPFVSESEMLDADTLFMPLAFRI